MSMNTKADLKLSEARIGRNFFSKLNDALEASVSGDQIHLLKDCEYTEKKLVIKDDVELYIPKGMKLHVGTNLTQGKILYEAVLYKETDDCTFYGSLTDALKVGGDAKVEVYTNGRNIDTLPNEPIIVGENTTFKINRPTELFIQGEMTVLGTVIVTTTDCVLHVVGTLNIEGTVDVVQVGIYGGVLIAEGDITISGCGKLLASGGMFGNFNLDAAVMHTTKKGSYTALNGYYARLNDALEDVEQNSVITLLKETSGFYTLNVPKDVELVVPVNTTLTLDTDTSLNIESAITVEDTNSIIGDTMCSLWFSENAVLSGSGLSAQSNFYDGQEKAAAEAGATYHWDIIYGDVEGWSKV